MKRRFSVLSGVVALCAVAVTPALLVAQVSTGSILLRVADGQGGVLPGVAVTIASSAIVTGEGKGVTDAGGAYRFPSLPPGSYAISLELQGFQTLVRRDLIVSVGQTTSLEFTMSLATIAETVTVSGESPTVDTTSANVNVNLNQALLQGTPTGRDMWSMMEYKVPGLVLSRPDVGGAAGGLQGSFTARGTEMSQNTWYLNGINTGDPNGGSTGLYYDYDAFEEVQISTGALDLSVPSAGVFLNMVTKTGGDRFNGKTSLYWQGDQLQGTNVDDTLLKFGFRKDAGAVEFISDANVQAGGPIIKKRLRFFGSIRDWRTHVNVPNFPEVEETNITSLLGNSTWQLNDKNSLTGFANLEWYRKPNRGASALNTPESNFNEDDFLTIYQVLWNSVLSKNAFMDARVTYNEIDFPLYQKGHDQSLFDNATSFLSRAAQQESLTIRPRLVGNVNLTHYVDRALGGRHELRFGFEEQHMTWQLTRNRIDAVNLFWNSATNSAATVRLFNSPVISDIAVDVTTFFVQDSYSVRRLTVNGGVRWDRQEGYLPEQESPPSQWFPNATRRFAAIRDIPNWKNLAPRVSVVYDLFGNGNTALKAAAGRYYYSLRTGTPNSVNPNSDFYEEYVWNDLNGDLRFQPGEQGRFLSRSGGLITSMDPQLKQAYTDELTGSVERELFPNMKLSVSFIYRRERDRFGTHDVGVPFSAYQLVPVADLGRDGVSNTADDTTVFVFDQDPRTLGLNRFVITNDRAFNQTYRGLEVTATKRFSNRWQMVAGYTLSKAIVNADLVDTPNNRINSRGPIDLDRTHLFKLSGSYLLKHGIAISGNVRAQTGGAVTRTARVRLTQGPVNINVEPRGSVRLDPYMTIDARLSKTFKISGKDLELMVEVYNLTNVNTVWQIRTLTGRIDVREGGEVSGARINQQQFLSPTAILAPRIARLGVVFRF